MKTSKTAPKLSTSMFSFALASIACADESNCENDPYGCTAVESSTDTGAVEPDAPELTLSHAQIKQFELTWTDVGAEYYQLLERANPAADYVQVGTDTMSTSMSLTVPLHLRPSASYVVRACNGTDCVDSTPADVTGSLAEAVGYFKPSETSASYFGVGVALSGDGSTLAIGAYGTGGGVYVYTRDELGAWTQQAIVRGSFTEVGDSFGSSVALSEDGSTLAVGALTEDSAATGIDGDPADNSAWQAGAVYVFRRDDQSAWTQQAYVKASNTDDEDHFGRSVALSEDGSTLAVGASLEDSAATGINGNQADNWGQDSGAVYVFTRDDMDVWTQQAYVKASGSGAFSVSDYFGVRVALSGDGNTLAVGATGEDMSAGAVHVFTRDDMDVWTQQSHVRASNTDADDFFGVSVALSKDGNTLAIGATGEDSAMTGIDGYQSDESAADAGAAYVFTRNDMNVWTQRAYVKSSNTNVDDRFGTSVALSGDGSLLAVGAYQEGSAATGIDSEQAPTISNAGAVYVFTRGDTDGWEQAAYVKASNTGAEDLFGRSVALSNDGSLLAVGAYQEDSGATGINGDQLDESAVDVGAVYLY
jgi:hypothetical protein